MLTDIPLELWDLIISFMDEMDIICSLLLINKDIYKIGKNKLNKNTKHYLQQFILKLSIQLINKNKPFDCLIYKEESKTFHLNSSTLLQFYIQTITKYNNQSLLTTAKGDNNSFDFTKKLLEWIPFLNFNKITTTAVDNNKLTDKNNKTENNDKKKNTIAIQLIGSLGVGKTTLFKLFHHFKDIKNKYDFNDLQKETPTFCNTGINYGKDFTLKEICLLSEEMKKDNLFCLSIWDMYKYYFQPITNYRFFMLCCFDISNVDSFKELKEKVKEKFDGMLIGMKSELERKVNLEEINEFCDTFKIPYLEISCKENVNILVPLIYSTLWKHCKLQMTTKTN
ncbi:hypothetical protein ABK040_008474 [Willaertia magna]